MSARGITLSAGQVRLIVDTLAALRSEVPDGCCDTHDRDRQVAQGIIDGLSARLAG